MCRPEEHLVSQSQKASAWWKENGNYKQHFKKYFLEWLALLWGKESVLFSFTYLLLLPPPPVWRLLSTQQQKSYFCLVGVISAISGFLSWLKILPPPRPSVGVGISVLSLQLAVTPHVVTHWDACIPIWSLVMGSLPSCLLWSSGCPLSYLSTCPVSSTHWVPTSIQDCPI